MALNVFPSAVAAAHPQHSAIKDYKPFDESPGELTITDTSRALGFSPRLQASHVAAAPGAGDGMNLEAGLNRIQFFVANHTTGIMNLGFVSGSEIAHRILDITTGALTPSVAAGDAGSVTLAIENWADLGAEGFCFDVVVDTPVAGPLRMGAYIVDGTAAWEADMTWALTSIGPISATPRSRMSIDWTADSNVIAATSVWDFTPNMHVGSNEGGRFSLDGHTVVVQAGGAVRLTGPSLLGFTASTGYVRLFWVLEGQTTPYKPAGGVSSEGRYMAGSALNWQSDGPPILEFIPATVTRLQLYSTNSTNNGRPDAMHGVMLLEELTQNVVDPRLVEAPVSSLDMQSVTMPYASTDPGYTSSNAPFPIPTVEFTAQTGTYKFGVTAKQLLALTTSGDVGVTGGVFEVRRKSDSAVMASLTFRPEAYHYNNGHRGNDPIKDYESIGGIALTAGDYELHFTNESGPARAAVLATLARLSSISGA